MYTGLFISPSGNSDLSGTLTGMVTPKGSMLTEGEILQFSVLPYRCSICPPLVTWQMSNLAILADSKTQNASLFLVHAMFRHDYPPSGETCKYATAPSTQKKNFERFSTYWYAPFCCVCLGCCAAEFGSSGGTYELPCICMCVCVCIYIYIYIYIYTHTHTHSLAHAHMWVRACAVCTH
jgi:hypothetical protein